MSGASSDEEGGGGGGGDEIEEVTDFDQGLPLSLQVMFTSYWKIYGQTDCGQTDR